MLRNFSIFVVVIVGLWMLGSVDCQKKPSKRTQDATSVSTAGKCKFYAKNITLSVHEIKTGSGYEPPVKAQLNNLTIDKDASGGNCTNRNGSIILIYRNVKADNGKELEMVNLTLYINYTKSFQWWEVVDIRVSATGSMIPAAGSTVDLHWTGPVLKSANIGADRNFSYACSKTNQLQVQYSIDQQKTIYSLQFRDLHLQPFEWHLKPGNFTYNVDDCVEFFSSSIWMFLISAFVFLLITGSGLIMLANMTTINRFDDPKSKPLQISAKE